jgi:hypothetical protein
MLVSELLEVASWVMRGGGGRSYSGEDQRWLVVAPHTSRRLWSDYPALADLRLPLIADLEASLQIFP